MFRGYYSESHVLSWSRDQFKFPESRRARKLHTSEVGEPSQAARTGGGVRRACAATRTQNHALADGLTWSHASKIFCLIVIKEYDDNFSLRTLQFLSEPFIYYGVIVNLKTLFSIIFEHFHTGENLNAFYFWTNWHRALLYMRKI